MTGGANDQDDKTHPWFSNTFDLKFYDKNNTISTSGNILVSSVSPPFQGPVCKVTPNRDVIRSSNFDRGSVTPSSEATQSVFTTSSSELYLEEEGLDIPWNELVLKKKIGKGLCYFLDINTPCCSNC